MDDELTSLFKENANYYAETNNINGLITLYNEYNVLPDTQSITSAIIEGNTDVLDFIDVRNVNLTSDQIALRYTDDIPTESKEWLDNHYLDFKVDITSIDYTENLGESNELFIDKMRANGFDIFNNKYLHEEKNDSNYRAYDDDELVNDDNYQHYHHVKDQ